MKPKQAKAAEFQGQRLYLNCTASATSPPSSLSQHRLLSPFLSPLEVQLVDGATTRRRRRRRRLPRRPKRRQHPALKRQHPTHRRPIRRRRVVVSSCSASSEALAPPRHLYREGHRLFLPPIVGRRRRRRRRFLALTLGAQTGRARLLRRGRRLADLDGHLGIGANLDRRSAERTRGVRMEPHVDAISVEAVVTLRQPSAGLVLLEFRQTDGALDRRGIIVGG